MDAISLLKKFKKEFEPHLLAYFDKKIAEAGKIDVVAEEAVDMIRDYTVSGGKRIRPAVLYFGYLAAGPSQISESGGKDIEKIMKVSMSMELLHSFLLIHDDIIDRDKSRHGTDTIHEKFKKIARKLNITQDVEHFGNSMAIIVGDMAAAMACDIVFNSDLPDGIIIKTLDKLQKIVFVTIPGEMIDVMMSYSGQATEEQILKMYEGKTARYTFEGPLHMGALFAGADEKILKQFSDYALPLGKAFQIKDDILGLFGKEKKIGKPVGSDIIEGKQTLLIAKALEIGSPAQKDLIKKYFRKTDLDSRELEEFREAVRGTGSLDYAEKLALDFVGQAKKALAKIDFQNAEAKTFLEGIADYIVKREA